MAAQVGIYKRAHIRAEKAHIEKLKGHHYFVSIFPCAVVCWN